MKYRIIFLFFFVSISCFSQKDSSALNSFTSTKLNNHYFYINAGIGYSLYQGLKNGQIPFITFLYADGEPLITSASPVYNVSMDYNVSKKEIIGLNASYQQWQGVDINQGSYYGNDIPENQSRLNIAFRWLHYKCFDEKTGIYYGIRAGLSYWNILEHIPATQIAPAHITNANYYYPSFQILFGLREYLYENLALNLEAGIGTPYLLNIGLSYRF